MSVPDHPGGTSLPILTDQGSLKLWSEMVVNEVARIGRDNAELVASHEKCEREIALIKGKAAAFGAILGLLSGIVPILLQWILNKK